MTTLLVFIANIAATMLREEKEGTNLPYLQQEGTNLPYWFKILRITSLFNT